MRIRVGRIVVIAILAEFLAVLTLVLIVALFGPADPAAAQVYLESLGVWVGPIAGFAFTLVGGWWVAKSLADSHLLNGFVLGLAVAIVDVSVLLFSEVGFLLIFAVSNIGRVIAGSIGGWIASRSSSHAA